jgi:hypothetical protein
MPSALKIQETGKANDGVAGVIEAQRLLGPVVVARTLGVLDSGTALMFVGTGLRQGVLLLQGQFLGVARRCGVPRSRSPVGPSTPGPA